MPATKTLHVSEELSAVKSSKKVVMMHAIQMELRELGVLFNMILATMNELKGLNESLKQDCADKTKINKQFESGDHMRVLIKAVYEWLYHLKNHIEGDQNIKRLVDVKVFEKLKTYCEFRGQLIAHKKGLRVLTMSALRYNPTNQSAEILMTSFAQYPETVYKEMSRLYKKSAEECHEVDPMTNNFNEQCKVLCNNLDKLPKDLRNSIREFLKKYGAISADIGELAKLTCDLSRDLMPDIPIV